MARNKEPRIFLSMLRHQYCTKRWNFCIVFVSCYLLVKCLIYCNGQKMHTSSNKKIHGALQRIQNIPFHVTIKPNCIYTEHVVREIVTLKFKRSSNSWILLVSSKCMKSSFSLVVINIPIFKSHCFDILRTHRCESGPLAHGVNFHPTKCPFHNYQTFCQC